MASDAPSSLPKSSLAAIEAVLDNPSLGSSLSRIGIAVAAVMVLTVILSMVIR